jgi:hypothetical protein
MRLKTPTSRFYSIPRSYFIYSKSTYRKKLWPHGSNTRLKLPSQLACRERRSEKPSPAPSPIPRLQPLNQFFPWWGNHAAAHRPGCAPEIVSAAPLLQQSVVLGVCLILRVPAQVTGKGLGSLGLCCSYPGKGSQWVMEQTVLQPPSGTSQ